MKDGKPSLIELIGYSSAYVLIATILYICGFFNFMELDFIRYFTIADYFNISVKALVPTAIGMIPGFVYGVQSGINIKANQGNLSKEHFILSILVIFIMLFYTLKTIGVVNNQLGSFIVVLLITLLILYIVNASKYRKVIFNIEIVLKMLLIFVVISYLIGTISAYGFMNSKIAKTETINFNNNDEIDGKIMFVLENYIIIKESKDLNYVILPSSKIDLIIEKSN